VLPYALPFAVVCACTLTFGRLSGDNEIAAMRVSGVHLNHVIVPLLVLAIAASGLTFIINDQLSPLLKEQTENIKEYLLKNLVRHYASMGLPTKTFESGPKRYHLYVDDIEGDELRGVVIVLSENGRVYQTVIAKSGRLSYDPVLKQLTLEITEGSVKTIEPGHPDKINVVPARLLSGSPSIFPISLERFGELDISDPELYSNADLSSRIAEYRQKEQEEKAEKNDEGVEAYGRKAREAELVMYGRFASSMSCFFLALLVVPLSISIRRGHLAAAFLLGLLVVVAYLVLTLVVSKFLGMRGLVPPLISVWLPNLLLAVAGSVLLYKVINR
jgi:lipopolysaccharide export LptBFGC system permease protein LptF